MGDPQPTERPNPHGSASARSNAQDASSPAALAHEMNNLLDGSLRSLGLAIRELRRSSDEKEPAEVIERLESADHLMKRMIGLVQVLGNAPGSNESPTTGGTVRSGHESKQTLGEALDHAVQSVSARADEQGVTVAAVADPELVDAPADALYTVMSNGLRNALDSIAQRRAEQDDPNGLDRVEVRIEQDGGEVLLTIADTGQGLDRAVTEPSGAFRFGVTTKPDGHGIGMGLCRQVARALGGQVGLHNRTPRGAVLTLRFPRSALRVLVGNARGGGDER